VCCSTNVVVSNPRTTGTRTNCTTARTLALYTCVLYPTLAVLTNDLYVVYFLFMKYSIY